MACRPKAVATMSETRRPSDSAANSTIHTPSGNGGGNGRTAVTPIQRPAHKCCPDLDGQAGLAARRPRRSVSAGASSQQARHLGHLAFRAR